MDTVLNPLHETGVILFPYAIFAFIAVFAYYFRDHESIKAHLFQIFAMGLTLAVLIFMANKKLVPAEVVISLFSAIAGYAFGSAGSERKPRS